MAAALTSSELYQLAAGCFCAGLFMVTWFLVTTPPAPVDMRGWRGFNRDRQRRESGGFRRWEPLIRRGATLAAMLPAGRLRRRLSTTIGHAGDPAGMSADEAIVFMFLAALSALLCVWLADLEPSLYFYAPLLGAGFILRNLDNQVVHRRQQVRRHLPTALELCALCVGAGMSLPAALAEIVKHWPRPYEPLPDELRRTLRDVELGNGLPYALEQLAQRVPVAPVQTFVSAVLQAEQRGSPLREVLENQATMQRQVRSREVEEQAHKMNAKLPVPVLLAMFSLVLLLLGPVLLDLHEELPGLFF